MPHPSQELSPSWRELAPGVWTAVVEPDAVTLGLVAGTLGCLLVDCGSSAEQGTAVRASVAQVSGQPLVGLVVTHDHRDHAGGLAAFADVITVGHETLAGVNRPIALVRGIDLGGRSVEVVHLGTGHTGGDLVVVVPDAGVIFAGDLVESAGPPWYGPDSAPGQWPGTLDALVGLAGEQTVIVAGHGSPMTRMAVLQQRSELAAVAGELRRLMEAGVPVAEAAAQGSWPYPSEHVAEGIAPGYAELAAAGVVARRRLPLA